MTPAGIPEHLQARLRDANPALLPLMDRFYDALTQTELQLGDVREAMIAVLEFLTSPAARTDANCHAVDSFLFEDEVWYSDWLPQGFVEVLADMGGILHDVVSAPPIARNFESRPEQLLARARALQ